MERKWVKRRWIIRGGDSLLEHSSQLKHRVEQIATHEEEMSRNMEKCMEQQQQLAQLVEGLGKQLSQLQINPVPNVAGKDFPTPEGSQMQGLSPNAKSSIQDTNRFRSGKNSMVQTWYPQTNWLLSNGWGDIRAYQWQFPEFVLILALKKINPGQS